MRAALGRALDELRRIELVPVLLVAGCLALLVLLVGPLRQAQTESAARLSAARDLNSWVAGQVAEIPATAAPIAAPAAAPPVPMGLGALERSLVAAGLRTQVARLGNSGVGGVTITFDAVDFGPLMAWLEATVPDWGYRLRQLRVTATDRPGRVAVVIEAEALP